MFLVLKLLVFNIWCCDGMRLGVQVMSACLVDVSVAGRVKWVKWVKYLWPPELSVQPPSMFRYY